MHRSLHTCSSAITSSERLRASRFNMTLFGYQLYGGSHEAVFIFSFPGDAVEDNKAGKNVSFKATSTVYSDSIIVDAIPRQNCDGNGNYINEHGKVVQVETQEKQLTRHQVVHMVKGRFKEDLDQWQQNRDQRVSISCLIFAG